MTIEYQLTLIPKISGLCASGKHDEAMKVADEIIVPQYRERAKTLIKKSRLARAFEQSWDRIKAQVSEPVLQQDDAAPNSLDVFQDEFKKLVGISFKDFKGRAADTSDDDIIRFESEKWTLSISGDDPYWALYKKEKPDA